VTIVEFLRARYDEREQRHRPIADATGGWAWFEGSESESALVLREVEAKRRIVAEIAIVVLASPPLPMPPEWVDQLTKFLRLIALPYADHPDYDESWRP
jgi:hypothetical protein